MKVILLEEVVKLGKDGDVVEVKEGYARNYLLPRRLAVVADKGNLKNLTVLKATEERKRARVKEIAEKLAGELAQTKLVLKAKSGEEGKLFGAVTNTDIARLITQEAKTAVDKRKIELSEPIKRLGTYVVQVKIHPEVVATVALEVVQG
ncbi:MAG: 50S ribosomal protein L9 [Armatimonadetes bacterium]|nr:50S ribosomal protein L9 [Armatimonadota bacterium]